MIGDAQSIQSTGSIVQRRLAVALKTITDGCLPYIGDLKPGYCRISTYRARPTFIQGLDLFHDKAYSTEGIGYNGSHTLWIFLCQCQPCILQGLLDGSENKMGHAVRTID